MDQGYAESRIPTATGDSQEFAHVYPLYSVAAITLAAFFGTPIAASWLMAKNYRRLGQPDKAPTTLLVGFAVTVAAVVFGSFLPQTLSLPLGIGLLFGVRSTAQSLQGLALNKHLREGGPFESKWRAFGISLIFLVAYCAVIAGVVYGATYFSASHSKIRVGARCDIYYKADASRQDAEALGKALQHDGFVTDTPATVLLTKKDGKTSVTFAVKDGFWDEAGVADSFEEVGREIAPSIGGFPITINLANVSMETKKEFTVGKISTLSSHLDIYYYGTANEGEAKALGNALEREGFVSNRTVSVFLAKGGDTSITFVVQDGWWDDSGHVAGFEELVRKVAPSVGGLPVRMRLANSEAVVKKESLVEN